MFSIPYVDPCITTDVDNDGSTCISVNNYAVCHVPAGGQYMNLDDIATIINNTIISYRGPEEAK